MLVSQHHEVEGFITFDYVLLPMILNYIFNIDIGFKVAYSILIDAMNLSRVLYKCNSHELSLPDAAKVTVHNLET